MAERDTPASVSDRAHRNPLLPAPRPLRERARSQSGRLHLRDSGSSVALGDPLAERESGRSGWSGVGGGPDPSADLLGQLDDDPLRAADVAEPVAVLIALQLADELRATGSQAGDDGVDVFDGECDMADARCVRRRVSVATLIRGACGTSSARVVRGGPGSARPRSLPGRPQAPRRDPPSGPRPAPRPAARVRARRKLSRGREVVNDDAHVVHPLDRHVLDGKDATLEPR